MKKIYLVDPFPFRVMKVHSLGKDIENEELPLLIEGIVGEHLARECNQVTYLHFKSGREIDFFVKGNAIEVKWGRERKGGGREVKLIICLQ